MRAPSLLSQCWPGLVPSDRGGHSISTVSERDSHLSSPAVEILPSKVYHCGWLDSVIISPAGEISVIAHIMTMLTQMAHPYSLDQLAVQQIFGQEGYTGLALITCDETFALWDLMHEPLTGIVSVADIFGFTGSEMTSAKPDGSLKSWDSSIDLVSILRHEIRDGQLSFRGKRVLELGCSYGLSGIFTCLKGASTVHFQDLNAETIRCTTIPNVLANLEQARDRQSQQPESPLTPSRCTLSPSVHFYAGDWEELPTVLSIVRNESSEVTPGMSLSFSEEDFMEGCSSQDGSIIGQEPPSRRSRKLSGSQAWERANETDHGGGYDVILITDIPYSMTSLKKLYSLIKKCLRPPYGVLYLATKRHYVGFSNGARHLKSLVDEEGIFGAHLVKEMTERDIWKFFFK